MDRGIILDPTNRPLGVSIADMSLYGATPEAIAQYRPIAPLDDIPAAPANQPTVGGNAAPTTDLLSDGGPAAFVTPEALAPGQSHGGSAFDAAPMQLTPTSFTQPAAAPMLKVLPRSTALPSRSISPPMADRLRRSTSCRRCTCSTTATMVPTCWRTPRTHSRRPRSPMPSTRSGL